MRMVWVLVVLRFFLLGLLVHSSAGESYSEVPEIFEMPESQLEGGGDVTEHDEGEDPDLEEMWVHYAIVDLAYYLRSHKFNEYDRRFTRDEESAVKGYYNKFPEPPLRAFQWEVQKRCSIGFIECLRYSTEYTGVSRLQKDSDPYYIMKKKNWTWNNNRDEIARADTECRRLYKEDWESPVPFVGPIHRFQWRTTISYFMCLYTLREHPELSLFGEPCNNYANCWMDGKPEGLSDPRADDRIPFNCARFSFCPDPCCPVKEISSYQDCINSNDNPCPADSSNRTCVLDPEKNLHLQSLAKNHWNLTCHCNEKGVRWESRFGLCVDVNECEEGSHNCSEEIETCLNLKGSYRCACAFGYSWYPDNGSCVPMEAILKSVREATLIRLPEKPELSKKSNRKEYLKKLFFWRQEQQNEEDTTIQRANIQVVTKPFYIYLFIFILKWILFE